MCYNAEISCAFFVVGAAVVAYICTAAPRLRATNIQWVVLFYTLMELLQTVQYWTVNECDKPVNRYLTEVAYVFVILQPLMWNVYFYQISRERERSTFFTAIAMSLCWMGVNLISRALYDPATNPQTKEHSVFANSLVCTRRQLSHLYWEWTSYNLVDFNANYLMYLMLWLIPGLTTSHYRTNLVTSALALVGYFMAYGAGEVFIFPSAWCYISVPMMALIVVNIYLFGA
eukprot:Em0076g15a